MNKLTNEERRKLFIQELEQMGEEGYLNSAKIDEVKEAYYKYSNNLILDENSFEIEAKNVSGKAIVDEKIITKREKIKLEKEKRRELIEKRREELQKQKEERKNQKNIKEKVILTQEQARERNVTWILIVGVILVLIGGLTLATNTWSNLNAFEKTLLIALISVLFYGLNFVTDKVLKIKKTSLAFLILGSLFIPITVIASGYFELFGDWFSINGQGKYLFLSMGAIIWTPIYFKHSIKYKSKLFVWFTYISSSLLIGFILGSLKLSIDIFYLGIILYNAILLFIYHKIKNNENWKLYTDDMIPFAQVNLILSTILLLMFFKSHIFYSFNVILTAIIYFSMIYNTKRKEYYFGFVLLLLYGVYELVENSILNSIDVGIFASLGFVFIGIQKKVNMEESIKKLFTMTSAIVTFCSFIFITYQGILIKMNDVTIVLIVSYLILAINYGYLSYQTKHKLFSWLGVLFINVAGFQTVRLIDKSISYEFLTVGLVIIAMLEFSLLFYKNENKYLLQFKNQGLTFSLLIMAISMISGIFDAQWIELFVVFNTLALMSYYIYEKNPKLKIINYMLPILISISILVLYNPIIVRFESYDYKFGVPFQFVLSALVVICLSKILTDKNKAKFEKNFNQVSYILYLMGLLLSFLGTIDETYVRPIIFVGSIYLFSRYAVKYKNKPTWIIVAISIIISYLFIIFDTLKISSSKVEEMMILGVILVFLIRYLLGKNNYEIKKYFFWVNQIYLFICTILMIIESTQKYHLLFTILLLYLYSMLECKNNIWKRIFYYCALTLIPLTLLSIIHRYDLNNIFKENYIFIISSLIIGVLWRLVKENWKNMSRDYLIPFSLIGLSIQLELFDFSTGKIELFLFAFYIILNLYFVEKAKWNIITIYPLIFTLVFGTEFNRIMFKNENHDGFIIFIILFIIANAYGIIKSKKLYSFKKEARKYIDWYSLFSLIYILNTFISIQDRFIRFYENINQSINTDNGIPLYIKIIPSIMLMVWLFIQTRRVNSKTEEKIVKTLAYISGLVPYYVIINNLSIPNVIIMEIKTLPWIFLTIFLSKKTWEEYEKPMNIIQWIVLVMVSFILMNDGLKSNTIMDAIIFGGLSLISVVYGLHTKIKSYFFVGLFMILLNVLLQTKPYWGNMPWWAYLLITGSILIGIASYHEWKKQKCQENYLKVGKNKLKEYFKKWK